MSKSAFKPGNMLYPLPAVMVSCQYNGGVDPECKNPALQGKPNIITVAWAGTVCTNPPMLSISVRPERYSYHMIEQSGEFVVNLTTEALVSATDYCGVRSGRDIDKFKEMHLTPLPSREISVPGIAESPVNIECRVRQILPLGSIQVRGIFREVMLWYPYREGEEQRFFLSPAVSREEAVKRADALTKGLFGFKE